MQTRKARLTKNTISSILFQITTVLCGFILPRLILINYGSDVNGLVNSITQFLQIISFLELGVGAVVQSTLYKPLAENDIIEISRIIASAEKFFKRLAYILLIYIVLLIFIYPKIAKQDYEFLYTAILIMAMSISSFAQYYFGVVDRLLLTADQSGYIQYTAQTITLIINTLISAALIYAGCSIQFVKWISSLIYLVRPVFLRMYVNRNYQIQRKIEYTEEPIKQKWNGVAQHVAAVVLDGTDNIVLTVFSSLSAVSIYSVYNMVVYGVKQIFLSMFNGVQSLMGELWAKQELDTLNIFFGNVEWILHTGVTFIFSCVGILLIPFVSVYTRGVADVSYYQPVFAMLITIANAGHCLRLPYNTMILAGGHYKQTQSNYIIAAIMNITISITSVSAFGLIGVSIGTLIAMLYQTVWMAVYNSKNFIRWPLKNFIKQICVDIITIVLCFVLTSWIELDTVSYISWIIMAIKTVFIVSVAVVLVNLVFYKKKILDFVKKILRKR